MSWLGAWLRGKPPTLGEAERAALQRYSRLPDPASDAATAAQRAVVVDVESSGLDPLRDRLISIGAVGVEAGLVRHADAFEAVLRQEEPSRNANIVVHGISGTVQLAGREPSAALLEFLAFAGKAPLVAFHAGFDRTLIERSTTAVLDMKPDNRWLDLALLAPALFPDQPEAARALDDWLRRFGIQIHDRHNALADALATAQLLLVALAEAKKQGLTTWTQLARLQKGHRWLARARRTH